MSERHESKLDQAIEAMSQDLPQDAALHESGQRAWAKIEAEGQALASGLRGCADMRDTLPAYVAGDLSPARTRLVKDHLAGCVACRHALQELRGEGQTLAAPALSAVPATERVLRPSFGQRYRALAAALVLALGLMGLWGWYSGLIGGGAVAQVASAEGGLYSLEDSGGQAMAAGDAVAVGQVLRSGGLGSVITLADGSRVEIAPRSELSIQKRGFDADIDVARGHVIVEASEQGSGHLFVSTEDCEVAVTGTVFSVKHGNRGSRVSVIEGEVRMRQAGQETVLTPGDQVSTDPDLAPVPFEEELGWSPRSAEHQALLKAELEKLGRQIDELPRPEPRYASELLDDLPAETGVVMALPNLSQTLADAGDLLEQQIADSQVLRGWWEANMKDSEAEADLLDLIDRLALLGGYLGDELVVAMSMDAQHEPGEPFVTAKVADPAGFRAALEAQAAQLEAEIGEPVPLRFIETIEDLPEASEEGSVEAERAAAQLAEVAAAAADEAASDVTTDEEDALNEDALDGDEADIEQDAYEHEDDELLIWLGQDRMVMSPVPGAMREAMSLSGGRLAGSDFHSAVTERYAEGVTVLFAVNLQGMLDAAAYEDEDWTRDELDMLGIGGLSHLVVTYLEEGERSDTRASLGFQGERSGMAAWLAEPAPMGALDFIAPDAHLAAAVVSRAPEQIMQELMGFVGMADPEAKAEMDADPKAQEGLAAVAALAGPMGGEMAFALDGPLLPEPAWKLVAEVNDAQAFQGAVARMLDLMEAESQGQLIIERSVTRERGRDIHHLKLSGRQRPTNSLAAAGPLTVGAQAQSDPGPVLEMHYIFHEGYMVMTSIEGMLDRAVQHRESGVNLRRAPDFDALMSQGQALDASALLYQNLGEVVRSAGAIAPMPGGAETQGEGEPKSPGQALGEAVAAGAEMPATLAFVYAYPDRIELSGMTEGEAPWMSLSSFLGMNAEAETR